MEFVIPSMTPKKGCYFFANTVSFCYMESFHKKKGNYVLLGNPTVERPVGLDPFKVSNAHDNGNGTSKTNISLCWVESTREGLPKNGVFNLQRFVIKKMESFVCCITHSLVMGKISNVLEQYTDVEDLSTFNVSFSSLSLKDKRGETIWLFCALVGWQRN